MEEYTFSVLRSSRELSLEDRIGRIFSSAVLELDGEAYVGKYELNNGKSIKGFIVSTLRLNSDREAQIYTNLDTNDDIIFSRDSAGKIAGHWKDGEIYQKTIVHIPKIINNMQFLEDVSADKQNAKYGNYSYYITRINMGGEPHVILSTVGRTKDKVYYDHNIFERMSVEYVFIKAKNASTDPKYSRLNEILQNVAL